MTLQELSRLSQQGECSTLEFKKKANYPEKIVKELVAFANSSGGKLLLGVDDNGELSGSREIEGEAFIVEKAISELIRPKLNYTLDYIQLTEKKGIAIFNIPESIKKPHFVKENQQTRKGTAYVRVKDESMQASREMREIMQRRLRNKDIQFTFGEKEKALLSHLADHHEVTLLEFAKLVGVPKFIASRTLIKLVLANILEIIPTAKGDVYRSK